MLPHEILATQAQRLKPKKIEHPVYQFAYEVHAHQGEQAGQEVWGFICPRCHVAVAVNAIEEGGKPCEFQHTCGAYILFIVPPVPPAPTAA